MNKVGNCDGCGRTVKREQLQELIFQDIVEDVHGGFHFKQLGHYCYACRLKIKAQVRSIGVMLNISKGEQKQ